MVQISCILFLIICFSSVSGLVCSSDKIYVKFTKQSKTYAFTESFKIYDNDVLLYSSPSFVSDELRVIEECLARTQNLQYLLKLDDTNGSFWDGGSWLSIEGINGNRVFKGYRQRGTNNDVYSLSLYSPIDKNSEWKVTSNSVDGSWMLYGYDDSSWTTLTLGNSTQTLSGTQYFRKQFSGLANMAAYEFSLLYRYGIVVYVNGYEVYRDNMPSGVITSQTAATGSYPNLDYHAVIRPGSEVQESQSILAVEIHFTSGVDPNLVTFNCYLSLLASSSAEDNCFIYPYTVQLTSTSLFDYDMDSDASMDDESIFQFSLPNAKAFINGASLYGTPQWDNVPDSFKFSGFAHSTWNVISDHVKTVLDWNTIVVNRMYFNTTLFDSYRVQFSCSYVCYLREFQLLTCADVRLPNISYKGEPYEYYAYYDIIHIEPEIKGFSNCTISPELEEGLSFDSNTCTLSGVVSSAFNQQYTVTATMEDRAYQGTFSLKVITCSGSMTVLRKVYGYTTYPEHFTVKDESTQQVVFEEDSDLRERYEIVERHLCLQGEKYLITVSSSFGYWEYESYLYIGAMLDHTTYMPLMRILHDARQGVPSVFTYYPSMAVGSFEDWHYKMAAVPSQWYDSNMSGWETSSSGNFPDSTNQIQLYKNQFVIPSLLSISGVMIAVKYQYGLVIYLNGNEVFKLGVSSVSTSSFSSVTLPSLNWRYVTIPARKESVNFLIEGTNTIAIALIAPLATTVASTFDCAVHVLKDKTSHVFGYSVSYSGMEEEDVFGHYVRYWISGHNSNNYITLTYDDYRFEWISSVVIKLHYETPTKKPTGFIVKGKNFNDDSWTVIQEVSNIVWGTDSSRRFWLSTDRPYNSYRIENISGSDWKIGFIDFLLDPIPTNIPMLSYAPTTIYKDIEMAELFPNSDYYMNFEITPALPNGIILDSYTGIISGTATEIHSETIYTITANKVSGEEVQIQLDFTVSLCFGSESLITYVTRLRNDYYDTVFSLYEGKTTQGRLIHSTDISQYPETILYFDFCLPNNIYTLHVDAFTSWGGDGFYISVDSESFKFESGMISSGSLRFSSYVPFQMEYSDWKVYKEVADVNENWKNMDFDDSEWRVVKAAEIGSTEAITTYIRKEVILPNIDDYQVMNVQIRYAGGVVCYFNTNRVARFNLDSTFDKNSESISVHSSTAYSRFHIILPFNDAVNGKNMIAFEIHRPRGQSSSSSVVFDATAVFGVDECSITVDSYFNITASAPLGDDPSVIFDLAPSDLYLNNMQDSYLEWYVENLEGTKFNRYALNTYRGSLSFGFDMNARKSIHDEPVVLFEERNLETVDKGRTVFSMPAGIAKWTSFKLILVVPASPTIEYSSMFTMYCKAAQSGICPGVEEYPPVGNNEISPGPCPYGYYGYSYRKCMNNQLQEIQTDKCTYKLPANLSYNTTKFEIVVNTDIHIPPPSYDNIITRFYTDVELPRGLRLNPTTGEITGTVDEEYASQRYTIYAENPKGATSTVVDIICRLGYCKKVGHYQKTVVGKVAQYDCAVLGSYIGTKKRMCELGEIDGEWQVEKGFCISISLLVISIVVFVVLLAVVIFLIVKATRKSYMKEMKIQGRKESFSKL